MCVCVVICCSFPGRLSRQKRGNDKEKGEGCQLTEVVGRQHNAIGELDAEHRRARDERGRCGLLGAGPDALDQRGIVEAVDVVARLWRGWEC